jgi:hypothetical protein
MYKIIFIDEQQSALDKFLRYIDYYKDESVIAEVILPLGNISEMVVRIFENTPDAIITDYRLNEYKTDLNYNIPYNGMELVHAICEQRENFPCFVLTTFADEAIPASDDVNIIYEKEIIYKAGQEGTKVTFLNKVKEQIRHYKTKIENAETELNHLIELRKSGKATIEDETRLIKLDSFLEQSLGKKTTIPPQYKELSNTKHLVDMLAKADELIKKLEES